MLAQNWLDGPLSPAVDLNWDQFVDINDLMFSRMSQSRV
jgi:hypothetical protein